VSATLTIEVVEIAALVPQQAAGFYSYLGCIYVTHAPNMMPVYLGLTNQLLVKPAPPVAAPSGVSEWTLLRAIAVAQNPDLIMKLQP